MGKRSSRAGFSAGGYRQRADGQAVYSASMPLIAAYDPDQIAAAEQMVLAADSTALLRQASAGLAAVCVRELRARDTGRVAGRRMLVIAGSGHNAADGLLAGARLAGRGVQVLAWLASSRQLAPGPAGALAALKSAGGIVVDSPYHLGPLDLVLDAVAGLSGRPGLAPATTSAFAHLAATEPQTTRPLIIAVDLPSGLDPSSGATIGPHVRADLTVTFGAYKPALLLPPASWAAGRIELVDLQLGPHLPGKPRINRLTPQTAAELWPRPTPRDHKYRRGIVGVHAGTAFVGAARLTCAGAARAGAGAVAYCGPGEVTAAVLAHQPETISWGPASIGSDARPLRIDAWAVGPGLPEDESPTVTEILTGTTPHVVDAGALAACVRIRRAGLARTQPAQVLLTPHAGELARLLTRPGSPVTRADVEANPWQYAQSLANLAQATVLIKGACTLVVPPDLPGAGLAYSQADGTPWLATAGAGDVLTGIAATLLAQGSSATIAGALAALIHGQAGQWASHPHPSATSNRSGAPILASDIAAAIPTVIANLDASG